MRAIRLFLHSRRTVTTLVTLAVPLAAAALFGGHVLTIGQQRPQAIPLVLIIPAALAALLGTATASPMRDWDTLATRRITLARATHLLVLLGLTVTCMLLTTPATISDGRGTLAAIRNLLGLTGITLMTSTITGAALCWLPELALAGAALTIGIGTPASDIWSWLFAADHDSTAAIFPTIAFITGTTTFILHGERGILRRYLKYS